MALKKQLLVAPVGGYLSPRDFPNGGGNLSFASAGATAATAAINSHTVDLFATDFIYITMGNPAPTVIEGLGYLLMPNVPYRFSFTPGDNINALLQSAAAGSANLFFHPVKGDLDDQV